MNNSFENWLFKSMSMSLIMLIITTIGILSKSASNHSSHKLTQPPHPEKPRQAIKAFNVTVTFPYDQQDTSAPIIIRSPVSYFDYKNRMLCFPKNCNAQYKETSIEGAEVYYNLATQTIISTKPISINGPWYHHQAKQIAIDLNKQECFFSGNVQTTILSLEQQPPHSSAPA